MRGYYLTYRENLKNPDRNGGCRGGVYGKYTGEHSEYEVEIGVTCNASVEMIAFLAHYDEIMEHLGHGGPMSQLIANSIRDTERTIQRRNEAMRQDRLKSEMTLEEQKAALRKELVEINDQIAALTEAKDD